MPTRSMAEDLGSQGFRRLHVWPRGVSTALFNPQRRSVELAEHYASGDIFLFPSRTETFGNVTLEAMASGLAVIAYDLAAAHELINPGHNGLLARTASTGAFAGQAVACVADPARCGKLKRHARETALQHDWPRLIARLERLFLNVCQETPGDDRASVAASTERP